MPEFPWTPSRGRFKGRTFESHDEYAAALRGGPEDADTPIGDALDTPPAPPPDAAPKTRRRKGKVTKEMVTAIVFPLNVGLYLLPQTRSDALTDEEMDRLTDAIVKVAAVNQWVERAIVESVESTAYVELAVVVGAISIKRAAAHGLLPASIGGMVDAQFGLGGQPEPAPEPNPNGPAPSPFIDAYAAPG